MAYEKEKDKKLWEEVKEFGETKVSVGVYKYEGLPPKIQISRQNKDIKTGDMRYSKLGRLTPEEAEAIIPLLQKALENIGNVDKEQKILEK